MKYLIIFLLSLLTFPSLAQDSNKGTIYGYWGWNRGWYSNSDIHFTGDNYDFTLEDVEATDRQSPFSFGLYFNPSTLTIPQTNFRLGYYITDKYDISFGIDHMKYVMVSEQDVMINGYINDDSDYDKYYYNETINLEKDFLEYEHTDGLNYVNFELTRNDNLLHLLGLNVNSDKFQLNTLIGLGAGALVPRSNVTLWNNERHDNFHLAGYGFSAKGGLNVRIYKYFFVRSEYKAGFIHMPDVRTSPDPSDKASQSFFFTQLDFNVGFSFNILNRKSQTDCGC